MPKCQGITNPGAKILVVGEAPGSNEERAGFGLVGSSGDLFLELLVEAEILPAYYLGKLRKSTHTFGHMIRDGTLSDFALTNVCQHRPLNNKIDQYFPTKTEGKKANLPLVRNKHVHPHIAEGFAELVRFVREVNPEFIIALGNVPLWALTGQGGDRPRAPSGITSWRGSQLFTDEAFHRPIPVLPTFHPAAVMRKWDWKFLVVHDLRTRAGHWLEHHDWSEPDYEFNIRPTYAQALDWLALVYDQIKLGNKIAVDVETTASSHITNLGFGISSRQAFNIPICCHTDPTGYWTRAQEIELRLWIREILKHPDAKIIGQNYEYDRGYLTREFLCRPTLYHDTMTRHHVLFPLLPKGLDFLSSLYCIYHRYWKDDNKEGNKNLDDDQNWTYNCRDAVVTYEVDDVLDAAIAHLGLQPQAQFEQSLHDLVYSAHQRGTRIDLKLHSEITNWCVEEMLARMSWLEAVVGRTVLSKSDKPWYASHQQTASLFYKVFRAKPIFNETGGYTTGDDTFPVLWNSEPLLRPILLRLAELRSLATMKSNVLDSRLTPDGRMLTEYSVAGTTTFRFASRQNGRGEGTNLQNITSGKNPTDWLRN